jgi:arginine utilization protein RocB
MEEAKSLYGNEEYQSHQPWWTDWSSLTKTKGEQNACLQCFELIKRNKYFKWMENLCENGGELPFVK